MADDGESITAGEVWESVDYPGRDRHDGPPAGLCLVVGRNLEGARESPGSFVMMRLTQGPRGRRDRIGKILYMHRGARLAGGWIRRGMLSALAAA